MARMDSDATTGAARTTTSAGSRSVAPSTNAARMRIPAVCDTLTDRPSPTACIGRPRVPTRYAAISVLPWPGVSACPAPSAIAVRTDNSNTIGVRVASRKIDGTSPPPTPPGTAGPADAEAEGCADPEGDGPADPEGDGPADPEGDGPADPEGDDSGTVGAPGTASPSGNAGRATFGAAGSIATSTCSARSSSGRATSSAGYDVSRSVRVSARTSPAPGTAVTDTPEPATAISRQPSRAGKLPSANASLAVAAPASGTGKSATKPHTVRMVCRPPTPGGKSSPADNSTGVSGTPSSDSVRSPASPSQAASRPMSRSASLTSPSASASMAWRAVNAGISAWSMTTSSRTRSGSTKRPA